MGTRKLSSIFLLFLVLNLNMVIPELSYASAEETCTCHLSSPDHQRHHKEGCRVCGAHKKVREAGQQNPHPQIKGMTCGGTPVHKDMAIPALSNPFLVAEFSIVIPAQESILSDLIENTLSGVPLTPAEKPPTV